MCVLDFLNKGVSPLFFAPLWWEEASAGSAIPGQGWKGRFPRARLPFCSHQNLSSISQRAHKLQTGYIMNPGIIFNVQDQRSWSLAKAKISEMGVSVSPPFQRSWWVMGERPSWQPAGLYYPLVTAADKSGSAQEGKKESPFRLSTAAAPDKPLFAPVVVLAWPLGSCPLRPGT